MKESSDKQCKRGEKRGKAGTWVWLGAGEHVATITVRGASVREPLQKAWLPIERQTWGGKAA